MYLKAVKDSELQVSQFSTEGKTPPPWMKQRGGMESEDVPENVLWIDSWETPTLLNAEVLLQASHTSSHERKRFSVRPDTRRKWGIWKYMWYYFWSLFSLQKLVSFSLRNTLPGNTEGKENKRSGISGLVIWTTRTEGVWQVFLLVATKA